MKMNVKGLVFVGFAAAVFAGAANAAEGDNKKVTSLAFTEATYAKKTDLGAAAAKGVDANFNDTTSENLPTTAAVATYVGTVANTADSALQTVTANSDAGVVTNIAKSGTAVTMTKAKVSGSDIADNAGIAATQLATGVQTSLGYADDWHTTKATYGDIVTHDADEFQAAGDYATNAFVGTIPAGSQATTVTGYVQEVAGTAGTALQTVTANSDAGVVTNVAASGTAVTMTKAKVTGNDIAADAGIAATQLASGVQTTLTNAASDHTAITDSTTGLAATYQLASDALPAATAASTYATQTFVGTIPAGSQATTVTGYVQEVAGTAGTALQPADITTGATAGTIAVNGTDVAVKDLKTVATSGSYNDLTNKPTLGTAAALDTASSVTAGDTTHVPTGAAVNTAITNATSGKTVPATSGCSTFPCALVATAADTFSWEPIQQASSN